MELHEYSTDELVAELNRRNVSVATGVALDLIGPGSFDGFWEKYPRKVAKKEAMKAWAKMDAGQRRAAIETIDSHSWVWANEGRGSRTVPHAATWLNGERWEDEVGFAPETDTRIPNNRTTRSQDVLDQMEQGQ